jgi:hypothetical protein
LGGQAVETLLMPVLLVPAEIPLAARFVGDEPHRHAAGAVVRTYQVPQGHILVTAWQGLIHEVIFQTPASSDERAAVRNQALLEFYADGLGWNEILDNGFGKTYRRSDLQRFALWSYSMDFNTFGTMEFHGVRWR